MNYFDDFKFAVVVKAIDIFLGVILPPVNRLLHPKLKVVKERRTYFL